MREIISLKNVSIKYGSKIVLHKIDLSICENQSVVFTGHNGCGKSTLLKVLAGLVYPTEGEVIYPDKLLFHYVPERFPKINLTAQQYLMRMGEIDGIPAAVTEQRSKELAADFFMEEMIGIPMKHLSKGTLQKVGVIQALLKKPQVLLLDEPLSGQDIDSQKVFIHKMNALRKENVTIIMSCHEQYLIESISDTIYSISENKIHSVHLEDTIFQKEYQLSFENLQESDIPDEYRKYFRLSQAGCILKVPDSECDKIILDMINKGWSLRGMYDAGN